MCVCDNPPGMSFASSFFVAPNTIDFSTVFSKFDITNASVYGTFIALLLLWILALVWARRKDNQDRLRVGVTVLSCVCLCSSVDCTPLSPSFARVGVVTLWRWLVSWCFKPSQPHRIISGLKETFIKRYIVERTNKAEIRTEEQSEKVESCREN